MTAIVGTNTSQMDMSIGSGTMPMGWRMNVPCIMQVLTVTSTIGHNLWINLWITLWINVIKMCQ